jgi:hypothetical protein
MSLVPAVQVVIWRKQVPVVVCVLERTPLSTNNVKDWALEILTNGSSCGVDGMIGACHWLDGW